MTDEYQKNVGAAVKSVEGIILNDLGLSSGVNPAMAQTHVALQSAVMQASAALGRPITYVDGYVLGIVAGLARLLVLDPRVAGPAFEDIAAHAIGGSAHARTAMEQQKQAAEAEQAAGVVQAKMDAEMAAGAAARGRKPADPMAAQQAQVDAVAAMNRAAMNAAPIGGKAPQPADPREAAQGAYGGFNPASEYGDTGFDSDGRAEG